MGAPSYSPPPPDPLAVQADQQAQQEQLGALQQRTQSDSASLMARYGVLALAGAARPTSGGIFSSAKV